MGKKITLQNTLTVEHFNGEWMCIWQGTDSDGKQVWCRIGKIHHFEDEKPPKGKPFGED